MSLSDRNQASGREGRGTLRGAPSLRGCLFRGCLSIAALPMIAAWSGVAVAGEPTKSAAAEAPGSAPIVLVIGSLPAGVDEVELRRIVRAPRGGPGRVHHQRSKGSGQQGEGVSCGGRTRGAAPCGVRCPQGAGVFKEIEGALHRGSPLRRFDPLFPARRESLTERRAFSGDARFRRRAAPR